MTTEQSLTPTHGRVLKVALPIVLSNMTVPLLGIVDTGVIGQLGSASAMGAVGVGAVLIAAIYWIFGFLRMGTTGMTAQAIGAGDGREATALLIRAMLIAGAGGLALIVLQVPIMAIMFAVSPASSEVETLARDYISIRIFAAPVAISIYGITGWLIAHERATHVLVLQLLMHGLNIALSMWFVLGLGWGIAGVALSTVIAEVFGALLGLYMCRRALREKSWRDPQVLFARKRLIHMLKVNADIMIRSMLLLGMIVTFTFYGASFDDVTLAANQVLLHFVELTAYALDGFAFAAEAIVGRAMGARLRAPLRQGVLLAGLWSFMMGAVMCLAFWAFGPAIIDLMSQSTEVREAARIYLPWMVLAPLIGVLAWVLDGVFIGATRGRDMRNMMLLSTVIYGIALLILVPRFGNHGLWAAFIISYLARGLTLLARYPSLERAAGAPRD